MTKQLKDAIERITELTGDELVDEMFEAVDNLREAYANRLNGDTDTQSRVLFLEEKLQGGMSKRNAAKALCEHDPRVGPGTAETLVYTVFSGMYQTSQRGRKGITTKATPLNVPEFIPPSSVDDDEGMI